jgi:hypothetical protein
MTNYAGTIIPQKASSGSREINGNVQSRKTPHIDPLTLSTRWLITPERARRTVSTTTQWGCERA